MINRDALISDDGRYRYWLRRGDPLAIGPSMCFVMLNPSTADAQIDDPTIRRCIGFARRVECSEIAVVNLFSYRATKPRDLHAAAANGTDPYGPDNLAWLRTAVAEFGQHPNYLIAAWGAHATTEAVARFKGVLREQSQAPFVWCLGVTQAGQPRHPLMLRADTPLEPWDWNAPANCEVAS